jgi:pimeloyl-ACP methyl ester carboxylesterase
MDKPAFILIPALGCDAGLYGMLAPAIAGHADPITFVPDADTLGECVAQVLARAPEKFFVGGTSFGGHVAREVALAAPERVLGLMVIGAGAGAAADPEGGRRRSARLRGGEHEAVMREMAANITSPAAPHGKEAREDFLHMALAADPQLIARQNDALVLRPDRWNDLPGLKMSALLLWGRDDRFSPAMDGLRMAGLIPNSRFVELEDVGHLPSLEAPYETADAIRHWLMDCGF